MKPAFPTRLWMIASLAALTAESASAVTVYGEASSTGPTITVSVFADITNSPLISFGFQLAYDPLVLHLQSASKNSAVWYLSDGTNKIAYADPVVSTPGAVLIIGGKLDGLNPLQGVSGQHVLLGNATFTRLAQTSVQFTLGLAQPSPFANFVTTGGTVLDGAPTGFTIQGVTIDPNDTNLDGLPDAWEIAHFGSISKYTWSDDPDHDGFNNLQEYQADTDPLDSNSYLRMTGASLAGPGRLIRWQGGVQATQYLERSGTLYGSNTIWADIFTSSPPTAITSTYTDLFSPSNTIFYRIRATR